MANVTIEQAHQLPIPVVRERLKALQQRLAEKYGVSGGWVSDYEAEIKGTGVAGKILCGSRRVVIELDLSFPVSLMKDRIESRIRRELAELLVCAPGDVPPDEAPPEGTPPPEAAS